MNSIKVEKRKLIEILQKLNIVSSGKATLPVLSTVLIKGEGRKIKFTFTNLELTIISQIEIPSEFNQSFCVSLVKFLSILKELTSEVVDLRLEKNFLWITCENCEFKLNIISAEEFPSLPILKDRQTIKLNAEILKEMINLTYFSVFTGEANYVLTGFLWEVEANILKITTSDTKRLATIERPLSPQQPEIGVKKCFIIPQRAVMELNKLLKNQEEIKLTVGSNQVYFDLGDTQLISQLIEGEFPDYQKVIPPESENKFKVNREKFLNSLKRANLLTAPEYQGVKLELKRNKLVVSKTTPQLGEYKEDIDIEFKGKELVFGFNPQYLIDILKVLEEEEVVFEVYASEKPLVLRNKGFIYLALPMRLS
ncbi:MAG: DNA polymerase III subunit beta [Candidatus Omnitrophica bacterium]|nr:DNA polymerase III subunit beta [Candidatus Omnitrophota bacterium]